MRVFPIVKGRRYRYIYFTYQCEKSQVTFTEVDDLIRCRAWDTAEMQFPKRIRLMQFNGREGIVRCAHVDQKKVIDGLNRLTVGKSGNKYGFSTQGCSGTLRALRNKYKLD